MSKKILIPIIIVLCFVVAGAGVAYAAQNLPVNSTLPVKISDELQEGRGIAQVAAIGDSQFTVRTKKGEKTLLVDANTRFFTSNGSTAAFSDLKMGEWVIGSFQLNGQRDLVARNIILLPMGFDPTQINRRLAGKITAVHLDTSAFSLHTRKGEDLTVTVNSSTIFLGKVQKLSELKPGMLVNLGAREENDKLVALLLWARVPSLRDLLRLVGLVRFDLLSGGRIISTGQNNFTIQTQSGDQIAFRVDAQTRFRSLNQAVKGFNDLKVGMAVLVGAEDQGNGQFLAQQVLVRGKVQ